ncbi:hypothetical protein A3D85_03400 [Candidatus Amesbacteria bacterium RIFCSPHIGHO2_02_FULL_47_9]|uniref:SpoVT-AbrB domain-containing protein n=1 Tax=Candidatus Amesbacteria bacterium RIFCSPHIGHO2_01_FULL_48_32b TaxID=1797253 RepID=A0A1F4YGC1_9BACT|nr:MAG: hypothetical protein A2876_00265 [Candidatus Amesbacteria bacterium RIFCSPHIGHO2_01_FULL_48_32b]OGD04192.1 MAG: hypothetical protein A3D85_03400 [Candidatus Amesbacteria bacterium RIFCSPHIGHO2_02_FULL_47_9]OGD07546.1 MAG: hypothetical protein A2899_04570 [Candidatus Amesbacteria bacterium RIFCSPLOWO2_01_FULL_49_25]
MYHKIILTGNSLAVTIPSKVVRSLGLRRGQQVSVSINLQKATLIYTFTGVGQMSLLPKK